MAAQAATFQPSNVDAGERMQGNWTESTVRNLNYADRRIRSPSNS